jgi:hypothetical protein
MTGALAVRGRVEFRVAASSGSAAGYATLMTLLAPDMVRQLEASERLDQFWYRALGNRYGISHAADA